MQEFFSHCPTTLYKIGQCKTIIMVYHNNSLSIPWLTANKTLVNNFIYPSTFPPTTTTRRMQFHYNMLSHSAKHTHTWCLPQSLLLFTTPKRYNLPFFVLRNSAFNSPTCMSCHSIVPIPSVSTKQNPPPLTLTPLKYHFQLRITHLFPHTCNNSSHLSPEHHRHLTTVAIAIPGHHDNPHGLQMQWILCELLSP